MEITCGAFEAKFYRSTAFVVEGQADYTAIDMSLKHLHSIFKWYGLVHQSTACFITLIDRIFCLEIQVTHDEGSNFVHDGIFITIRDVIVDAFAKVGNRLNIKIKLKFGFWCKKCEKLKERHISLLEGHEFCYCINNEPTKLQRSRMVWFKTFKVCMHSYVRS